LSTFTASDRQLPAHTVSNIEIAPNVVLKDMALFQDAIDDLDSSNNYDYNRAYREDADYVA